MQDVEKSMRALTEAITDCEIYRRYIEIEKKLESVPELKKQLDDYRKATFALNNAELSEDEMFDRTEALTEEYETLRNNALANSYLEAELDMCRMMKKIHDALNDAVPFLTPWENSGSLS